MDYIVKYDFRDKLLPHGEDGISYQFSGGNLAISVDYEDSEKSFRIDFDGCAYQYFAPIPGYHPEPFVVDFKFQSGCVYELFNTELLKNSEAAYQNPAHRPGRRHFFLYLEWENVAVHVLALSIQFSETGLPGRT